MDMEAKIQFLHLIDRSFFTLLCPTNWQGRLSVVLIYSSIACRVRAWL